VGFFYSLSPTKADVSCSVSRFLTPKAEIQMSQHNPSTAEQSCKAKKRRLACPHGNFG